MDSQKVDTELQLSLLLTPKERSRSLDLDVGYDAGFQEWELIIKYSGNIVRIEEELAAVVTPLLNEYAIIRIAESQISRLSEYPEIEFIEKPKGLILEELKGIRASCITSLRYAPYSLSGRGTVIAIIDSGIDYSHPDFRREDGATRILAIWDQSIPGNPPEPYNLGSVFTAEDINRALTQENRTAQLRIVSELDSSGHGTHVAGIAAGNGRASEGVYVGAAPEASLLIVKLAPSMQGGFPRTSELMQAIDWVVRYGVNNQLPVAVNLSYGNNYGNHLGDSLLEQYMDDVANLGRTVLTVGAGNEGNTNRHAAGRLPVGNQLQQRPIEVEFSVSPYESGLNIQLWKEYADTFDVAIRTPSGIVTPPVNSGQITVNAGITDIAFLYGQPTPYSASQEIYIALIPQNDYVEEGLWAILLYPRAIRSGRYELWLPVSGATNDRTGFLQPTPYLTLTIPSTASRVITVGAYDSGTDSYAAFSGRGSQSDRDRKPDLVAPGVGIIAAAPGGGYDMRSGTSMAAPFVSGGAALLMEWGIIQGNDAFLYGEKLKAYLLRGARRLPGYQIYPNEQVGWGALCVADSIPKE